jgi:hypothetical protein
MMLAGVTRTGRTVSGPATSAMRSSGAEMGRSTAPPPPTPRCPAVWTGSTSRYTQLYSSPVPLKGQCHEIFCFWFYYESVFPQPQSITLGPFQIFSTIRGDIRMSRCTTGINDIGGKDFCHLPPASTTLVVHLELRISPRIFVKIRNGLIGILRGLETDS